jgi:hypothetical protein
VGALGLVKSQGVGERVQDAVGGASEVSTLQAVVVVDAEAGQQRDFFSAQPRHATLPEDRQARVVGCDAGAAGGEEVTDLALGVHRRQA